MGTAKTDEAKGRAKRAAGEIAGDDQLRGEGTVDKVAGKIKDTVDVAADKAKDLMRKADRDRDGDSERDTDATR